MAQGTTPPLLIATTIGDLRYSAPSQLQRCSNTHFTLHRLGLPLVPAGHAEEAAMPWKGLHKSEL